MNNISLIVEYENVTLWELPELQRHFEDSIKPSLTAKFDNNKIKTVLETCENLESFLLPIAEPKGIFRKLYNFLFDKTLGYLEYVNFISISRCV